MRKISDSQILQAHRHLRKLAQVKQALSTREKMLMALLGITAVPAGLNAVSGVGEEIEDINIETVKDKVQQAPDSTADLKDDGSELLEEIKRGLRQQQSGYEDDLKDKDRW